MKAKLKKKVSLTATDIGGGEIIEGNGLAGGTLSGTSGSDIAFITGANNVALSLGHGDDIAFLSQFAGSVLSGTGNDYIDAFDFSGRIDTGAGGDAVNVVNGTKLAISTGTGFDIISVANGDGKISAGTGGDIVQVSGYRGTIDLGRDRDGDILIIDGSIDDIKIVNFDETRDILIINGVTWSSEDQIA